MRILLLLAGICLLPMTTAGAATRKVNQWDRFELRFQSRSVEGNPFDGEENDIHLLLTDAKGKEQSIPAFYDGEATWKVRWTPSSPGDYRYRVVAAGKTKLAGAPPEGSLHVTPSKKPGFVRIDPRRPLRFGFSTGQPFFPVGHNVAWTNHWDKDHVEFDGMFRKMHAAGEDWARVWMASWGGLSLEWTPGHLGEYDLDAARYLDQVFTWAEENGIYVQLVLQYHGQFSTRVNPAWQENPYSRAKGGFLDKPGDFFTDPKARKLFQQRMRYVMARWSYSPHLMAWELFNEVQFTDIQSWDAIAGWHRDMARFIREKDPYHHLITTSSPPLDSPVWAAVDYMQVHSYNENPMVAASGEKPGTPSKPYFVGEWGGSGSNGDVQQKDAGRFLRRGLWAGLMTGASASSMFWAWDFVESRNLYPVFGGLANFVRESGYAGMPGLHPAPVQVDSPDLGSLTASPGLGWDASKESEFRITPQTGPKIFGMPSFIQGRSHPEMMPHPPTLLLNLPHASDMTVEIAQNSASGSIASFLLDGKEAARREFPGGTGERGLQEKIVVHLPTGDHRLTLANDGEDWYRVSRISVTGYTPMLKASALVSPNAALVWLYNDQTDGHPVSGKIHFDGLAKGRYSLTRYDTSTGKGKINSAITTKTGKVEIDIQSLKDDEAYLFRKLK